MRRSNCCTARSCSWERAARTDSSLVSRFVTITMGTGKGEESQLLTRPRPPRPALPLHLGLAPCSVSPAPAAPPAAPVEEQRPGGPR
ncbi:hypothetical protein EYF80_060730 [Liparis tanakae]|uniref:Uncharacterized protein n=1 Tax=Liparis tanakae TaxID=230148 RepID=A0A4Z2EL79_9TELE|nr:hypothetical protein EYF80_060730 [Liparis tanakae]